MEDEEGREEKVIAVAVADLRFSEVQNLPDLDNHWLKEIENFFAIYKLLENKVVQFHDWGNVQATAMVVESAFAAHQAPKRGGEK